MIFRMIASILHLFAVVVRREAEIDNLKEKAEKARKEIHTQTTDLQEANRRLMVLEIQRESDKNRIAALEQSLATHRDHDDEICRLQNQSARAQSDKLNILSERLTLHLSQTPTQPTDN